MRPGALPALEPDITRALWRHKASAEAYEGAPRNALGNQALDRPVARRGGRFLDLLVGKSQLYVQQLHNFYLPELPNL